MKYETAFSADGQILYFRFTVNLTCEIGNTKYDIDLGSNNEVSRCVFDFQEVEYIVSCGLSQLLLLQARLKSFGIEEYEIINDCSFVKDTLIMSNFNSFFKLIQKVEEK